jgi:hypothetical protein
MMKWPDKDDWWNQGTGGGKSAYPKCAESHPALTIGQHVIYGGSCSTPKIKDADLYVGFDSHMQFTKRHWPWESGEEILFEIQDMHAPKDHASFHKLVCHVEHALKDGKKVHCGCIGGHGRTGTFFAALVAHMTGETDAISYVRKHYCHKAVESQEQVKFLHKHYGVVEAKGHKDFAPLPPLPPRVKAKAASGIVLGAGFLPAETKPAKKTAAQPSDLRRMTVHCTEDAHSIWGKGL